MQSFLLIRLLQNSAGEFPEPGNLLATPIIAKGCIFFFISVLGRVIDTTANVSVPFFAARGANFLPAKTKNWLSKRTVKFLKSPDKYVSMNHPQRRKSELDFEHSRHIVALKIFDRYIAWLL